MKKQYLGTIEEAVDAQFEYAKLLGVVQKTKWTGLVISPVLFVALFFLLDHLAAKLIIGGSAAVLHAAYHLSTYEDQFRKRLRKFVTKARGSDQSVESEFEIDETGLTFRQQGQEITITWGNVENVVCTDEAIRVLTSPSGVAAIPKRIFESAEESKEWVAYIKSASNR